MIQSDIKELEIEDGTSLGITIFSQNSDSSAPVIICWPAMGIEATYYQPLVEALYAGCLNIATADLRGLGGSSVRASRSTDFGYHEIVSFDFPAVVNSVRNEFPGRQIFLLGHSLGGQLACLFAAANPDQVSGIILVATCSVFFRAYGFPTNIGLLVLQQFARAAATILGYFPGPLIRFGGWEPYSEILDWAHQGWTGRYELRGTSIDFEALLAAVDLPVLSISFTDDTYCPKRPICHLLEKMKGATKTHLHLSPEELGTEQMGHFGWVKQSGLIIPHITHWLDRVSLNKSGVESRIVPESKV